MFLAKVCSATLKLVFHIITSHLLHGTRISRRRCQAIRNSLLTIDEFKGKEALVIGSAKFNKKEILLKNRLYLYINEVYINPGEPHLGLMRYSIN